MTLTMDLLAAKEYEDSVACKGRFYRVRKESYVGKRIVFSTSLSLLKRKSCPGCRKCEWIEDDINEGLNCSRDRFYIEGLEDCKDMDIIQLAVVIDGTDWESGFVDSWHMKAVIMK